ncbi:MAG TPA: hypothetical protein ENN46_02610 [Candidatus Woesearchaeota archaeon]|nr:hypothetical protein [Candidatus Woesearchaeota archaeon]
MSKEGKMRFEDYVEKIQTLDIQGAENVAKAAMHAVLEVIEETKDWQISDIKRRLKNCSEILRKTRPTEPAMMNSLNYSLHFSDFPKQSQAEKHKLIEEIIKRINFVLKHFEESDEIIAEIGEKKIKKNSVVYTHCHSSTVMRIIKRAWDKGTRFEVFCTETKPHYQGRRTAIELSEHGIPVTYFIDSAARIAIKKADIMLIGADAITNEGKIINKIGSELFSFVASTYDVPVYACTNSWKFDPHSVFGYEVNIEEAEKADFWHDAPEKVMINRLMFERVDPKYLSGVISELGIYSPVVFSEEIKRKYDWFFKKA